jgi:flavocytochrome c
MSLWQVPEKWDAEADVIVIGGGNSGLPAAITASDQGARVMVLETSSGMASSLAMISGGTPFAGIDIQKEHGIEDSADALWEEAVETSGGSPELWRAIADRQLETYEWLKSIGARAEQVLLAPGQKVMRSVRFEGHGPGLCKLLRKASDARPIEMRYKHRAERLILDPESGRVIGIQARHEGKVLNFRAGKAVILATGGFVSNARLVKEYGPNYTECIPTAPPTHMGDGLVMALDAGAATAGIGLAVCPSMSVCVETKHPVTMIAFGGIAVKKKDGKRWCSEIPVPPGSYTLTFKDLLMEDSSGEHAVVYDDKCRRSAPPEHYHRDKEYSANTVEDLEKILDIAPGALKKTIDEYNSDIERYGYDRQFGRKQLGMVDASEPPVKLDTPPYYAIKCKVCLTSMKGGLKINARSQIIDQFGDVIPGLYACGEIIGGLMGKPAHYYTGAMTLSAFVLGRIAGDNAAGETSHPN